MTARARLEFDRPTATYLVVAATCRCDATSAVLRTHIHRLADDLARSR